MKALQMNANSFRFAMAKAFAAVFGKKAYFYGPGRTVKLVDIPEPSLPSDDWVKIRTIACGFCGSDLNIMLLHDSPSAEPFTSFPCIMGHEFIGGIVEAGANVNGFGNGDRVAVNATLSCEPRGISPVCSACSEGRIASCENPAEGRYSPGMFTGLSKDFNGAFAPYVVAHKSRLFHVPEALSMEEAVMTEPVSVALQALYDNMPWRNEKILVVGGGVIGNLIVQCARALVPDCHITVIEPSPFAAKRVSDLGADEIIFPKDIFSKATEITGAKLYNPILGLPIAMGGFNRVYDTVANTNTLNSALRVMKAMGTLSMVGVGKNFKLDPTPLWLKQQTIKGVYGHAYGSYEGKKLHMFDIAMDLMVKKKINTETLVTHKFKIEEYLQMIEVNMNKGKHKAIKTVVTF